MWKLINLRHFDIIGTDLNEMPKEMSRLGSLQTLSNFVVSKKSGSTVKRVRGGGGILYLHGTLQISKLQNVVSTKDAAEAGLVEKTNLMRYCWNGVETLLIWKMTEICFNSLCLIQI